MKHARILAAFALVSAGPLLAHPHQVADTQAGKPDKIVCKRIVETGSLVKGARTCKTKKTWQLEADAARRAAQDQQLNSLINSERGY